MRSSRPTCWSLADWCAGLARRLPGFTWTLDPDAAQGEAVIDARIDGVSFTGSAATGRSIAKRTAERLIPVSLELGGKNAAIVLDDADLDRASAGVVWGALANGGQNCAAVSRVYVLKGAAAEFEKRVRARLSQVKSGPDAGEFFDVPPLINARRDQLGINTVRVLLPYDLAGSDPGSVGNRVISAESASRRSSTWGRSRSTTPPSRR